ncbi:very short patch repair endonuclease [Advenella sp. RU8]|uniref:very short patch repair endonuclease n=1 Tax=Advenella sp. RU8 TaxID=3399575 RepID=UPI003AAA310C
MDIVDAKTRSKMMSHIRSKDTKPEMVVRKYLHHNGFRFRLHSSKLQGHPDLVLPKYKICIFIHGCYWHRHENCKYASTPQTRKEFWLQKFKNNIQRDIDVRETLISDGWRVIVIWECALKPKKAPETLIWLSDLISSLDFDYVESPLYA